MTRNRIVGVLRFSYPAKEGFAVSGLPEAALEAHLYAPERLERRFAYLETVALPSLAAQTDPDFRLVVLAGTSLPMRYRRRLRALAERHAFAQVVFLDRMGALAAAKRAFRRGLGEGPAPDHLTGFRMDDDDAVSTDYVAATRDAADRAIAAGLADQPLAIAFARGVYWDLNDAARPFHDFRESQPLGLACAMVTTGAVETCIYRYNHRRLACHVPTLMLPGSAPMFLRTLHGHNDSGRAIPPHARAMPPARGRRLLADRFGLDVDAAMALMDADAP